MYWMFKMVHSVPNFSSASVGYEIKNFDSLKSDSSCSKKIDDEPDSVERATVKIFAKLHSLADYENRSEKRLPDI